MISCLHFTCTLFFTFVLIKMQLWLYFAHFLQLHNNAFNLPLLCIFTTNFIYINWFYILSICIAYCEQSFQFVPKYGAQFKNLSLCYLCIIYFFNCMAASLRMWRSDWNWKKYKSSQYFFSSNEVSVLWKGRHD